MRRCLRQLEEVMSSSLVACDAGGWNGAGLERKRPLSKRSRAHSATCFSKKLRHKPVGRRMERTREVPRARVERSAIAANYC